jgi:hypothetical protein
MDVEEFFDSYDASRAIFDRVLAAASSLGPIHVRVTKSQVALVRVKPFAWTWVPEKHLGRRVAPLVLTFSFGERRPWLRWKQIYQAAPRHFSHHLELWSPEEVDDEVQAWLRVAWEESPSDPV